MKLTVASVPTPSKIQVAFTSPSYECCFPGFSCLVSGFRLGGGVKVFSPSLFQSNNLTHWNPSPSCLSYFKLPDTIVTLSDTIAVLEASNTTIEAQLQQVIDEIHDDTYKEIKLRGTDLM